MLKWFSVVGLVWSLNLFAAGGAQITLLTADKVDIENFNQPEPFNISTDTSNLVLDQLKDYQISLKHIPLPRIEELLQSEQNYCMFNRVKNPYRAKHTLFSLPLNLYPGLRLYSMKSFKLPKSLLDDFQQLMSLNALFKYQPKKVLGVSKGRSYGEYIDGQIALIDSNNLYIRAGAYRFDAIIKMLSSGKIDYLIEFPSEINDVLYLLAEPRKLQSIAFANTSSYLLSYVACSDTPDNRRLIRAINGILRQLYQSPQYYLAHSRYINQSERPAFKLQYQQVFGAALPDLD
jgi:uncharacterized protein (TIGR02285 family)